MIYDLDGAQGQGLPAPFGGERRGIVLQTAKLCRAGGKRFMEGQSKEPYSKQRDLMAADSTFEGCSSMSQIKTLS